MLINGSFLTHATTEADRFALELLAALGRRGELAGARVVVPRRAELHAAVPPGLPVDEAGARLGVLWEQLDLPRLAGAGWLINLGGTAPMLRQRQLVLLPDAAAVVTHPEEYGAAARLGRRLMTAAVMQRADCVATLSRFGADELTRHFGQRPRGIEVLPPGGDHILRERADRSVFQRLDLRGRRYWLVADSARPSRPLGADSARPSRPLGAALQALEQLADPHVLLVAAEREGKAPAAPGAGTPAHSYTHPRLRRTGAVSPAQWRALFEGAACFVDPSTCAASGMAVLEAMNCGCPTLAAQRGALPEVCADASLYFDPADPATLAAQLQRLLGSSHLAHELRAAGHERARLLSWDATAQAFSALGQRLAV